MSKLFLRAFSIWFLFGVAAFINGVVRQMVILPSLKSWIYDPTETVFYGPTEKIDLIAHAISSVSLSVVIGLIIYFTFAWLRIASRSEVWLVGGLWVGLTMAFEFGLGRATGTTWSRMLEDYNIFTGHLWLLVLATELLMPVVLFEKRKTN